MTTIASPGLGSGLNVNDIVDKLVAIEQRPVELLTKQKTTLQAKLSSFGLLKSYTTNVHDAVARLADPKLWQQTSALTTDPSAVSPSSTAAAVAGTYSVEVQQLAQAQSLASGVYTSSTASVGTGTLRIEIGGYGSGTTFTPQTPPKTVDIVIGAGEDSLESVRAKINAADAGVTASIVKDASGARLAIRSTASGVDNAIRITATADTALPVLPSDPPSLASLVYDPGTPGASQLTQTVAAKNALATINGLAVSSASNTFTDAIEGVSLNLSKVTTSAVQIQVGPSNDAFKKAINDFVKSYNDINTYLTAQTKYDPDTKTAGTLQGDGATLSLKSQLRSAITFPSGASSVFQTLSNLGIELQTGGNLSVNDSKLTAALGNLGEVSKAFSNPGSGASGDTTAGLAVRVQALTKALIQTDGAVTTRTAALQASIKRADDDVAKYQSRIEATKARLLAQYGGLDAKISRLNSLNTYINQQFFSSNNTNN